MGEGDLSADGRIPVFVVTGFLGSGKTTLVNHLLKTAPFKRSAVVVNEYGRVSVDHLLVEAPHQRVRFVDSGCLCGHVHEEVASSLLDLHCRRGQGEASAYDCVLIETSGLADPVPILQILVTDPVIIRDYALWAVVTVVDGVLGRQQLVSHPESVKQAAVADVLVVGKTDLARAASIERLARELVAINPGGRQVRVAHGELDPALVTEGQGFLPAGGRQITDGRWLQGTGDVGVAYPAALDPSIATFTLEYDEPISVSGFVLWMNLLAGFRGAGLLRVKGVVNVEGDPYAVQAVQTVITEPVRLESWPDAGRRSRLVFITRHMDAGDVQRTFAAFKFDVPPKPRNMVINPETFAKFKQSIEPFRTKSARTPVPAPGDITR